MNKAVPWNINGVGFDAREAAREAARRQGKSLGEWLHGVIADHAAELGVEEHEIGGKDRVAAVTSRLERLGARQAGFGRKVDPGFSEEEGRQRVERPTRDLDDGEVNRRRGAPRDDRPRRDLDEDGYGGRRPRRAAPHAEETDLLLEEAIDAMERRTQRAETRTDHALASFAKMLESNEAKRDREREAVLAMGQKLTEIETRLSAAPTAIDQTPIKGALARLEARLDTITRRGAAEAVAKQGTAAPEPQPDAGEPLRRLEEKVNSILQVVAQQPAAAATPSLQASPVAVVASQGPAPLPHRRLGDAIAEISRRQRSLDDPSTPPEPVHDRRAFERRPEPMVDPRHGTRSSQDGSFGRNAPVAPDAAPSQIGEVRGEIAALAAKIDEMRRGQSAPQPLSHLGEVRSELASLAAKMDEMRRSQSKPQPQPHFGEVRGDIALLAAKMDELRRSQAAPHTPPHFGEVKSEIASLAAKMDEMRRDISQHPRSSKDTTSSEFNGLRTDIASMSQTLRGLAPRGSLTAIEESIKTLTQRLEATREQVEREAARPAPDVVGEIRRALAEMDPRKTIASLQGEVQAISRRIEGLGTTGVDRSTVERIQDQFQEVRDMLAATASRSLDVEHIEQELAVVIERMDRQVRQTGMPSDFTAATDDIRRMIATSPGAAAFEKIERRLEALAAKVDASVETADRTRSQFGSAFGSLAKAPAPDVSGLEQLVRELGDKIEAAQAPGADARAMEALQHQVTVLATRFDHAEGGLASLVTLERSMGDLFAHLEETRASVDVAAARAAQEVLRIAAGEGQGNREGEARGGHDIALLRSLQDEADKRTHTTLTAVHETLRTVVDRLATVEGDIASVRTQARPPSDDASTPAAPAAPRPVAKAATRPPMGASLSLGAADPMMDAAPMPSGRPRQPPPGARAKPVDLDGDAGRADFIAAARRAAHAAQNDPSVVAIRRPSVGVPSSEARAGLIARSREYVAAHKKPVLLSVAAILVVLGTLTIVQRAGLQDMGTQVAAVPLQPKVKRLAEATPTTPPVAAKLASAPLAESVAGPSLAELTPSALPKNQALGASIPGSDPIQTGSIPSLPAFAAGPGPSPQAARPSLPSGLKIMADAGDSAAEYELGSRYAEGKLVPRDFAAAARWYAKAADQGSAPAQYRLASLYEKGLGIGQDKAKAKALYLKAADAGNPRAMHNLAVLLADGDGKPDYDGAATWFRKAAQFGVHDSQFNLAILLARGLGVPQSLVQSYQWFAVAADQNDEDAAKKRDEIATKLGANDLAVAKALAASFRPRTANLAATEVTPPPGGWDGAPPASHLNSARPKISSL